MIYTNACSVLLGKYFLHFSRNSVISTKKPISLQKKELVLCIYYCKHTGVSWIISKFHPKFQTKHVNDAPTLRLNSNQVSFVYSALRVSGDYWTLWAALNFFTFLGSYFIIKARVVNKNGLLNTFTGSVLPGCSSIYSSTSKWKAITPWLLFARPPPSPSCSSSSSTPCTPRPPHSTSPEAILSGTAPATPWPPR